MTGYITKTCVNKKVLSHIRMEMSMFLIYLIAHLCVQRSYGNPLEMASNAFTEQGKPTENRVDGVSVPTSKNNTKCTEVILDAKDVRFLRKDAIFVLPFNTVVKPPKLSFVKDNLSICFLPTDELKKEIFSRCMKFRYDKDEFEKFPNGSVLFFGSFLEAGTYEFNREGKLVMCAFDYDDEDYDINYPGQKKVTDVDTASIYIGKIGSSISILALLAHIATFCLVPSLRNLPGYNLLSLSVAFLMAYSFVLIAQIPKVLGIFCVVSGILKQYFFLAAFFCMNVMAFDVWKTLRLATEKLMVCTETARRRQFLWYSLYAWLFPLFITITSVVVDNMKTLPDTIKPQYGRGDVCWMTNNTAKAIFFAFPAFTLFVINTVFFGMSAFILKRNTMKQTDDHHRQHARLNFVLYVRLAIMMGITWLIGVIAIVSNSTVIWFFFDILNSLQGLFLFLLFTCSRKVLKHIKDRMSANNPNSSEKNSTNTTKCDSK